MLEYAYDLIKLITMDGLNKSVAQIMRFSIKDMFWLTAVVALITCLMLVRRDYHRAIEERNEWKMKGVYLEKLLVSLGGKIKWNKTPNGWSTTVSIPSTANDSLDPFASSDPDEE